MKFYVLFLLGISLSAACNAAPITANVIGSTVGEEGVVGAEYRSGYDMDDDSDALDGAFTDRIDLFYNMTDDSQFRVFFNRINPGNADADVTNMFIEPAFQLFHADKDGFDGAILTGLTLAEGDNTPHQLRTVLTGTIPYHSWSFVHNSVIAHQLGADHEDGVRYEARWRVMHHVGGTMKIGAELFNNFGNLRTDNSFDEQNHRAGPVMTGAFTDRIGYQTGLSFGLSENAPDVSGKFWLSYQFDSGL